MQTIKSIYKRGRMWLLLTFRHRLRACGRGTYIAPGCHFRPRTVSIGAYSFIGNNCRLAIDDLVIGNYVMLASNVAIVGGDHVIDKVGTPMIHAGRAESRPVIIEDDVWIGHGCIVLHGTHIGEGAIIAAGSIVTKDIPPYCIAAGAPAKPVRMRLTDEEIRIHRSSLQALRSHL